MLPLGINTVDLCKSTLNLRPWPPSSGQGQLLRGASGYYLEVATSPANSCTLLSEMGSDRFDGFVKFLYAVFMQPVFLSLPKCHQVPNQSRDLELTWHGPTLSFLK